MLLKESELILNSDGSIYHLNLKPEHVAKNIIFVGDPDRVEKVTQHFNTIEFTIKKREFKTQTGTYKGKRLTVISTGIGLGNIDIVMNELDALVNIDLNKRVAKIKKTTLNIVRIGTSGALQNDIPVNSFLISEHAIDLSGMLRFYEVNNINNNALEHAFINQIKWNSEKARPIIIDCSSKLLQQFNSKKFIKGITLTASGFYGPQGRVLRLPLHDDLFITKLQHFIVKSKKITNFEMETAIIYGMAKLLGHHAISLNAILANRASGQFSKNTKKSVNHLIEFTLDKFIQ